MLKNNFKEIVSKTNQKSNKRSAQMLMLLALLVLLLHVMLLTWLRQSMNLPKAPVMPIPFKLEVSLLGKNGLKTSVAPPPAKSQPQPEPKPESKPTTNPKPKPKPKKIAVAKEKLPDVGDIEQLIKSRPAKLVGKSVKYQPEQQTAQTVSSAMMLPPAGSTSAIDNFPESDSHNPSPEYPEMAVFLGYQGTAVIRIKVSAQGISKGVEILRSSGHKILDESAAKALKKWRFTPSKNDNDKPMTDSVIISVIYILYGNNH